MKNCGLRIAERRPERVEGCGLIDNSRSLGADGRKRSAVSGQHLISIQLFPYCLCRSIFGIRYLALSLLLAMPSLCAPVEHWMDRANKFYEQAQYDSAAAYYERIVAAGFNNAAVYYNLGNANFRLRKLGAAIMYYEKALKLAPNDPDVIANLKFANANIQDRIPAPEQGFFGAILWRLHTLLDLNTQLWLLLGALTALAAFFSIGLFASHNARLWMIYASCLVMGITFLLGISAGYKIHLAETSREAVVLASSLDARSEPNGAKILFTVHEGAKFRIRKEIDRWSLVSLPNGVSGWVESEALGRI